MRSSARTLAILVIVLWSARAAAQTPVALTLEEAIARGVAEAPRLAEARARQAACSRSSLPASPRVAVARRACGP